MLICMYVCIWLVYTIPFNSQSLLSLLHVRSLILNLSIVICVCVCVLCTLLFADTLWFAQRSQLLVYSVKCKIDDGAARVTKTMQIIVVYSVGDYVRVLNLRPFVFCCCLVTLVFIHYINASLSLLYGKRLGANCKHVCGEQNMCAFSWCSSHERNIPWCISYSF